MIGLRSQSHLRQQLQCGQRFRSFSLVYGAGAQVSEFKLSAVHLVDRSGRMTCDLC